MHDRLHRARRSESDVLHGAHDDRVHALILAHSVWEIPLSPATAFLVFVVAIALTYVGLCAYLACALFFSGAR